LVVGADCLQFAQLARNLGHLATRRVSLCRVFLTSKLHANCAQTARKLRIWQPQLYLKPFTSFILITVCITSSDTYCYCNSIGVTSWLIDSILSSNRTCTNKI